MFNFFSENYFVYECFRCFYWKHFNCKSLFLGSKKTGKGRLRVSFILLLWKFVNEKWIRDADIYEICLSDCRLKNRECLTSCGDSSLCQTLRNRPSPSPLRFLGIDGRMKFISTLITIPKVLRSEQFTTKISQPLNLRVLNKTFFNTFFFDLVIQ